MPCWPAGLACWRRLLAWPVVGSVCWPGLLAWAAGVSCRPGQQARPTRFFIRAASRQVGLGLGSRAPHLGGRDVWTSEQRRVRSASDPYTHRYLARTQSILSDLCPHLADTIFFIGAASRQVGLRPTSALHFCEHTLNHRNQVLSVQPRNHPWPPSYKHKVFTRMVTLLSKGRKGHRSGEKLCVCRTGGQGWF